MGLAAFNAMRRAMARKAEEAARADGDMPSAARASARAESESGTGANPGETGTDFKKLTTDGLKAALTGRGIAFDAKAKKADLLALLEQA